MPDDAPDAADLTALATATQQAQTAAVAAAMPQRDRFSTHFVMVVAGAAFLMMITTVCALAIQQKPILQDLKELAIAVFAFLSGSLATLAVPRKDQP